ncbi:helix-hairpin-helix domain-containing protein [Roseovarius sp. B08]|uniref:helix-hairpin-helix domain-containing protein n=1 Tax=Roseovarius sp. B08 TaxID=3449223 RepID=UPI003EDC7DCA
MTDLTRVTGIGPGLAAQLTAAGLPDAEALAKAQPADILTIRGIGAGTAPVLIARARHLTAPTPAPSTPATPASQKTSTPAPAAKTDARPSAGKKKSARKAGKKKEKKAEETPRRPS